MSELAERLHDWDSFTEWEPTNNDEEPTTWQPGDFPSCDWRMWDPSEYVPHPDMEGLTCSTGFHHIARRALEDDG